LAGGYVECALQKPLTAAGRRGAYRLDQIRHHRGPASEGFLLAIQAAVEELGGGQRVFHPMKFHGVAPCSTPTVWGRATFLQ
jgi:hypothetical protein